jgi:hypothetical protein
VARRISPRSLGDSLGAPHTPSGTTRASITNLSGSVIGAVADGKTIHPYGGGEARAFTGVDILNS